MPCFGKKSLEKLATIDPRLQKILTEAIKIYDFAVICGHRGQLEQNQAFESGNSKTPWPLSKHNSKPSKAVDIVPWPVDWQAYDRFAFLAGIIFGIASQHGVSLRWGGNFDGDDTKKDSFIDMPHIEIVD